MGKFTDLLPSLKAAVLAIHTDGNGRVAAELADAFGPYGVPLTMLTREEASTLAAEFGSVHDWDVDQGAITRFLNRFVNLFPDETFVLLTERITENRTARARHSAGFRTFGLVYGDISFGIVPTPKRMELADKALRQALLPNSEEEYSDLFWQVAGVEDATFDLILQGVREMQGDALPKLTALLDKAIPRLAFVKLQFVKELLRMFHGSARERVVEVLAYQSYRHGGGVIAGDIEEAMARQAESFRLAADGLPEDAELDDLMRAIRRFR